MKILFLLDEKDEKGTVVAENSRALEVLPTQLQLRMLGPSETWLAFPVGNPAEGKFIPLVPFAVGLAPAPVDVQAKPVKKAKAAKKGK